jgi:hypothetical protein
VKWQPCGGVSLQLKLLEVLLQMMMFLLIVKWQLWIILLMILRLMMINLKRRTPLVIKTRGEEEKRWNTYPRQSTKCKEREVGFKPTSLKIEVKDLYLIDVR